MKKVIIIIAILLAASGLVFGALIAFNIGKTAIDEQNYEAAMNEFRDAVNEGSDDSIKKVIELSGKVESTGDYGRVEKAIKTYIRDVVAPYYEAAELQNNSIYATSISPDLITKQQPDFKQAYGDLNLMTEKLNKVEDVADNLFSREAALKYLGEEKIDDRFIELFDKDAKEFYDDAEFRETYYDYINTLRAITDYYRKILDFLTANTGSWHLEDDVIAFKTTNLTNQYNALINDKNF